MKYKVIIIFLVMVTLSVLSSFAFSEDSGPRVEVTSEGYQMYLHFDYEEDDAERWESTWVTLCAFEELECADTGRFMTYTCTCVSEWVPCDLDVEDEEISISCNITDYIVIDEEFVIILNITGEDEVDYSLPMVKLSIESLGIESLVEETGDRFEESNLDSDADGFLDSEDFCPDVESTENSDVDGDGVGDACDNCPQFSNPAQTELEQVGCSDPDQDGYPNFSDRCPAYQDFSNDSYECLHPSFVSATKKGGGKCSLVASSTADFLSFLPILIGIIIVSIRRRRT